MPILFDSSLYIDALRKGDSSGIASARWAGKSPLWLSSVVLEELYAGASPEDQRILERIERDFERMKRILVPNLTDWTQAGKLLGKVGFKYGYEQIGQARLTNDALIAASASRAGITVLTANRIDFSRLAEFCPLQWQVQAF